MNMLYYAMDVDAVRRGVRPDAAEDKLVVAEAA